MKSFNHRAFVALAIAFSGIGLPVTGIANHLYQFDPMGTARHAWMAAHNILGFLFAAFSILHVVINRRALGNYLRGLVTRAPSLSRESLLAGAMVGVLTALFVGHAFLVR